MAESSSRSRLKRKPCDQPREEDGDFRSTAGSPWWRYAEDQLWALTLRSAVPVLEDQHWVQVPELPQPCAVPAAAGLDERGGCDLGGDVPPFPEALGPQTSQQEVPDQTRLEADPGDGRPRHALNSREEEQEQEAPSEVPAAFLQTLHFTEGSDPPQAEGEHGQEVQNNCRMGGGASGGGGVLQSCPMCLLVFPVGFTQMDVDGHLCQCLSEMNVDMTW